jgi:hypothetical protein
MEQKWSLVDRRGTGSHRQPLQGAGILRDKVWIAKYGFPSVASCLCESPPYRHSVNFVNSV